MLPALWLPHVDTRPSARARLVCCAHAGGGAAPFLRWHTWMPDGITVCPTRRPGRESAFNEPLLRDVPTIAAETVRALQTLPELPCVLLGHSLGAVVAFEVARLLQSAGQPPLMLIASGRAAPQRASAAPPLADLPADRFVEELDLRYGGIPRELKQEPELLEMLLPILRADLAAAESYRFIPGERLRCPILVAHGRADQAVDPRGLPLWAELTDAGHEIVEFAGDHFFPYDPASGFLALLRQRLARLVSASARTSDGHEAVSR